MGPLSIVIASPTTPNTLSLASSALRQVCSEVPHEVVQTDDFLLIVQRMFEIMYANDGAGLAAPQVGILWRLVVVHPSGDSLPPAVLINPRITYASQEVEEGIEACLSLPDFQGLVPRSTHVVVESASLWGQAQQHDVWAWQARLLQHELDHLDGILYPLRMAEPRAIVNRSPYAEKARSTIETVSHAPSI
jgi:peptide deformylase